MVSFVALCIYTPLDVLVVELLLHYWHKDTNSRKDLGRNQRGYSDLWSEMCTYDESEGKRLDQTQLLCVMIMSSGLVWRTAGLCASQLPVAGGLCDEIQIFYWSWGIIWDYRSPEKLLFTHRGAGLNSGRGQVLTSLASFQRYTQTRLPVVPSFDSEMCQTAQLYNATPSNLFMI